MASRGRKRSYVSETASPAVRRSRRVSSSAGGLKSEYFEPSFESENVDVVRGASRYESNLKRSDGSKGKGMGGRGRGRDSGKKEKNVGCDGHDYQDDEGQGVEDEDEIEYENGDQGDVVENEGDDDDASDEPRAKRSKHSSKVARRASDAGRKPVTQGKVVIKTGDGPKITIIPLTKMRDEGGVPYEAHRLHPNTLLFLKDLKANNRRSWLKANEDEFRRALKDWEAFVEALNQKMMAVDDTIPELPFKDINFRIYRDVRFSKNPLPYKTNFGVAFSRTGRKGPYACYYVHLEPGGKSFVGGGLWQPETSALQALRASIDERPGRWRSVLLDEEFRRAFLPATAEGDENEVKREFAAQPSNKENALKRNPRGFPSEHRDIRLLKLRNFTVAKAVPDSLFTSAEGQKQIAAYFRAMVGFIIHLNNIVMPDPGADDNSDQ